MTRDLTILLIRLEDELNRLFVLQQVLQIALEQFDGPHEKTMLRVDLLIDLYLAQAEYYFDEMKAVTNQIRQLLRQDED